MSNDLTGRLSAFTQLVARHQTIDDLPSDVHSAHAETLRDVYFDRLSASPSLREQERASASHALDSFFARETADLDGLEVSWHPSSTHRVARWIPLAQIPAAIRDRCHRATIEGRRLGAVFVDPVTLGWRTFENILPLGHFFERAELDMSADTAARVADAEVYTFTLDPHDSAKKRLLALDELGLYARPLNPATRGGKRFIFHASELAAALGDAIRQALPEELLDGFSHVNPVLRLNRFEPGDAPFSRHLDTPYYDPSLDHVSRYTLLLYLTEGSADKALELDGASFDQLDAFQCVIFHQSLPHAGRPFDDGAKVFLRTELIFEDRDLQHDERLTRLFMRACYASAQELFNQTQYAHTQDCYDRAARAHWGDTDALEARGDEMFWDKEIWTGRGLEAHYITNGHDYWFLDGPHTDLKQCAALALYDFFGPDKEYVDFYASPLPIERAGPADMTWIPAALKDQPDEMCASPPFDQLPLDILFPPAEAPDASFCCPVCDPDTFSATRSEDVIEEYVRMQQEARAGIQASCIFAHAGELHFNPENFIIQGDKIHVLSSRRLEPINFAAYNWECWQFNDPEDYVHYDLSIAGLDALTPPILWREVDGCYHLMLHIFQNTWVTQEDYRWHLVPKIITDL